jgi:beta-lactamase class A
MINKKKHEIQILLSQVKRDKSGNISFIEDSYQLDENKYFYPASTAKLPIAILALQKIKSLRDQGIPINADTPFLIKNKNGETIIDKDSTNINGDVTINHLIKKIFLVSDNDAYNYLFDFLGRDYINNELIKRGLKKTQIHHKFLLGADNVNTWEYTFIDENQNKIFHQSSMSSKYTLEPHKLNGVLKG